MTNRTYHTGENLVDEIDVVGYSLLSMDYTYDDNKNVTAETFDSAGAMDDYSFTAGYDDENRLTSWDRSNGDDQDWTLSLVGDWDSFSENGTAVSRTHNDVHELTAIGANSLTYDVKGNLLTDTDNHTYTWDFDNHLATAVVGSMAARGIEGNHEYEYDALGRRVAKEVSDDSGMTTVVTRTLFINNYQLLPPLSSVGGQVVAEYEKVDTGSMTLARTYVYGEYVDEPLSLHSTLNSQPSTLYYHTNRVYNVIGLTDINDDVIEVYTYTPYGTVDIRDPSNMSTRANSSYGNTYTFTGRRTDQETGLHYFRARYMDSVLGRFIGRDPQKYIDGRSLYSAYFVPDYYDPTGAKCSCPGGAWTYTGSSAGGSLIIGRSSQTVTAKCRKAEHRQDRIYDCDGIQFTVPVRCGCTAKLKIVTWSCGAQIGGSFGAAGGTMLGANSPEDLADTGWTDFGVTAGGSLGVGGEFGTTLSGKGGGGNTNQGLGVSVAGTFPPSVKLLSSQTQCLPDDLKPQQRKIVAATAKRGKSCKITMKNKPKPYGIVDWGN